LLILGIYLASAIRKVSEHERAVVFRLGRVVPPARGPGMVLTFAPIDKLVRVSIRDESLKLADLDVKTLDGETVKVNVEVRFHVTDPVRALCDVNDYRSAMLQLSQAMVRRVIGEAVLDDLPGERDKLKGRLLSAINEGSQNWGVKVIAADFQRERGRFSG
jgi:regulator of protease activity HflC (stomatin/prohibitin superfamily)